MNIINWVINNWVEIAAAFAAITQGARLIVKLTPTPRDDAILAKIVAVLKHVGLTSDTIAKPAKQPVD